MNIIYYSFVKQGGSTGPSVNETTFISSLDTSEANVIKICRSYRVMEKYDYRINDFGGGILGYAYFCFAGFLMLSVASQKNTNRLIVFRLSPLPISELLFCLFNKEKFVIKTFGDGLLGWKQGTVIGRINRAMLSVLAKKSCCIDTVSEQAKSNITKVLGLKNTRIVVVDNAVDTTLFSPRDKYDCRESIGLTGYDFVIGYTGNYPLERGGREVIDIVAALCQKHNLNCAGLILGDDDGVNKLKNIAKNKGLSKKMYFPGRVTMQSVPIYASALDVGLSILPPEKDAASGQKVRQYAALGIRILSTQRKDAFIEKMGLGKIVAYGDSETMASFTLELLKKDVDVGKAHEFAVNHLSTSNQLKKRMEQWKSNCNI